MGKTQTQQSNNTFEWQPFSVKQLKLMTWWTEASPYKDCDGIICDGAVRSGKTIAMSPSFVNWAMETFNGKNFAICGKTIGALQRNVIRDLGRQCLSLGYDYTYKRTDNLIIIGRNTDRGYVENYFYCFGGRDESSQDLIQGLTLAGIMFDEVALMPRSFVMQGEARCSVSGAKMWYNCNPKSPSHWFYEDYLKDEAYKDRHLLYLHFLMTDNLTIDAETRERYERSFTGVFYQRNILGLWVTAEGKIYTSFNKDNIIKSSDWNNNNELRKKIFQWTIGVDFGGNGSAHAFVLTGISQNYKYIVTAKEKYIKEVIDPNELNKEFIQFVKECIAEYGNIAEIRPDSAEQVLIKGFRTELIKNRIAIPVRNAIKGEIIDRIRFNQFLFSVNRYYIVDSCKELIKAFDNAVWQEDKEDVRLDDGTTNIDSLDAEEYSIEKYIPIIMKLP